MNVWSETLANAMKWTQTCVYTYRMYAHYMGIDYVSYKNTKIQGKNIFKKKQKERALKIMAISFHRFWPLFFRLFQLPKFSTLNPTWDRPAWPRWSLYHPRSQADGPARSTSWGCWLIRGHYITNSNKAALKGNPSKWPYICMVWFPQNW